MGTRKTRPAPDSNAVREALAQAQASTQRDATCRFQCTLVTPMYGGGVKAGEVDLAMPIRATAIRGQLRQWWRLLNRNTSDGKPRTPKALFEAERAIWGGLGDADTLAASRVIVQVECHAAPVSALKDIARFEQRDGRLKGPFVDKAWPSYVVFPGQGSSERGNITREPAKLLQAGYKFQLTLRFDKLDDAARDQVLDALRWWATFGGVGARTRRGCGAVEVLDVDKRLVRVDRPAVERAGFQLVVQNASADAMTAWNAAAEALRTFRQGEGLGRNQGRERNRPGRSRWPEPDAIRRMTGKHASLHKPEHKAGNVFPRAAFGLPIITHFKDGQEGDPGDTTLKPIPAGSHAAAERMASPLILRPYLDNGRWHPAVLCLDMAHVNTMGLALEGKERGLPTTIPSGQWQAGSKADTIKPLDGHTDAIAAFLAYFGQHVGRIEPVAPAIQRIKTFERPNLSKRGSTIKVEPKGQAVREITGADAQRLYDALSEYARQRLDAGKQFNRLDITFDGFAFAGIKEYQA